MTLELDRTFRHVGGRSVALTPNFGLEEEGYKGRPTEILAFTCTKGGQTWKGNLPGPGPPPEIHSEIKEKITLGRGEECTMRPHGRVTKHINSGFLLSTRYPTEFPEVRVDCPDDMHSQVEFGRDAEAVQTGPRCWKLDGTLLPYQSIVVVWWKESLALAESRRLTSRRSESSGVSDAG